MINTLLCAMLHGLSCAIVGVTINVIMPNERILNWWFRIGTRVGIKHVGPPGQESERERWFYRPIWGCEKCLSGQIALWSFICLFAHYYSAFGHVLAICTAIFSAVILSTIIKKATEQHD